MTDLRYRTNMIVNYLGGMSKWELNVSQKKLIWAIFPTRLFTGARDTQRIALEQTLEIAVVVSRSLLFAQVVCAPPGMHCGFKIFKMAAKVEKFRRLYALFFNRYSSFLRSFFLLFAVQ